MRFTLHLPLRNRAELEQLIRMQSDKRSPLYRHFLTPAQFRAQYGVTADAVATVGRAFAPQGIRVVSSGSQDLILEGPVSGVERALGTQLFVARGARGGQVLASRGSVTVPAALRGAAVIGLDAAVINHPHSSVVPRTSARIAAAHLSKLVLPHNELSPLGGYLTSDLKQAYQYPSYQSLTGRGATIAVLMDGAAAGSDIAGYFSTQHLPTPRVSVRPVDGGAPTGSGDFVETTLDIQQSAGMAPGAAIAHYNIPDLSDSSIYDGYKAIVEDNVADVVSSSFGGCERYYSGLYAQYFGPTAVPSTLYARSDLYAQGTAQGQTFVASSGDNGAVACFRPSAFQAVNPNLTPIAGVENPASDPYVASVGGTNLVTTFSGTSQASQYVRENAFGDKANPALSPFDWGSGGGESQLFAQPFYQQQVGLTTRGRTVPDLAGHMGGCPGYAQACGTDRSSVLALVNGAFINLIGTSASAPDFAGLVALTREAQGGRFGLITPSVYAYAAVNNNPIAYFHGVIPGFNGLPSRPGYDEITGVGTVLGLAFTGLPNGEVAGDPGTPSNPGPAPTAAGGKHLTYETTTYRLIGANSADLRSAPPYVPPTPYPLPATTNVRPRAAMAAGPMTAVQAAVEKARVRPRAASSGAGSGAGIDGCGGDCGYPTYGFAASPTSSLTATEGLAITADFAPALVDVFSPQARAVSGFPKRLELLLGANHVNANGITEANCQFGGGFCERLFFNIRSYFDTTSQRFWLYATEQDLFFGDVAGQAASTWIAISDTANANGTWKSYQYALDDGDDSLHAIQVGRGGFALNAHSVVFSGDVDRNDTTTGAFLYSYVATLDRQALEQGRPPTAYGFRHLQIDGRERGGQIPVQPRGARDGARDSDYLLSSVDDPTACTFSCTGVLAWTVRSPGPAQQLSFATIATGRYRTPPNWSSDGFQPVTNTVRSTPVLFGGNVSLAFPTGAASESRIRTGIRWEVLSVNDRAGGGLAGSELAGGTIVAPVGTLVDHAVTMSDGLGNVDVSYVAFNNDHSYDNYIQVDRTGRPSAPRTAYAGLGVAFQQGPSAAAPFGSNALFVQPYGTANGGLSVRIFVAP